MVVLMFVQSPKNSKGIVYQEIMYDVNQAIELQKTGKCFVAVCIEGLTAANIGKWIKQIPKISSLNVVSDKQTVEKIRYIN